MTEARSYTREEIQEAGLDDFRFFLIQVWDYLGLPPPTPVQLDIAYWLQHGDRRKITEAFRGVGKSWITVAFVLWLLWLDPQKKIMVVSANESLAQDFVKFCFQLIHGMPMLQHLAPREDQRKSSEKFDVGPSTPSKDPSLKSVGITGQLTGSRADVIVADDIEVPKNSYTPLLRERLAELVKEFDAVLKPDGVINYLGTPQNEDSLYNKLVNERGYAVRIWPAEIPAKISAYNGHLAPHILKLIDAGLQPGEPVDPKRFSREDLGERKASYGRSGYALQFMLDTTPSDADRHPLKCRDLIVAALDTDMSHVKWAWSGDRNYQITDLQAGGFAGDRYFAPAFRSPEMAPFSGTIMAIDPSGRGKDETAYAIVRVLHSTLYLIASGGYLDGFAESTLQSLAAKAARYGVNYVIAEENYGGGMFNQLLKPWLAKVARCTFDDEWDGWSKGQKELRILDTMEPLLASHRLVVDRAVIEQDLLQQAADPRYSLVYQMTRIGRYKNALPHDDRIEAVAMACGYWTEKMAQDVEQAVEANKDALLEAELENFIAHVFQISDGPATPSWFRR